LSATSIRYGGEPKLDLVKELWDQGFETYDINADLLEEYVIDDTEKTKFLYENQNHLVDERGMRRLVDLQNEYTLCLSEMEVNGLLWDEDRASSIIVEFTKRVQDIEHELQLLVGEPRLNIGSGQQLSAALFGGIAKVKWKEWVIQELKTKPYSYYSERELTEEVELEGLGFTPDEKTKLESSTEERTYYSVDQDALSNLKARTKEQKKVKQLLEDRSSIAQVVKSLAGQNGDAGLRRRVMPDGLIHPNFNQTIARTGRLTSSDPNGQNLPRGSTSPIKEVFVPRNDCILQWDLSQIEWRVAAVLSNDQEMIHEINNLIDQHIKACVDLMELPFKDKSDPESKNNRNHAKTFNFRMIYGGSFWGFFLDPKMPRFSKKKWIRIVERFFEKYFGLKSWHDRNISTVQKQKGKLRVETGRWFQLHKEQQRDGTWAYREQQIKNYPVQGVAGGDVLPMFLVILRRAMIKIGFKSKMILTVHDSVVFDCVEKEREALTKLCIGITKSLPRRLEAYFGMNFPVRLDGEAEYGPNYGKLKFYVDSIDGFKEAA